MRSTTLFIAAAATLALAAPAAAAAPAVDRGSFPYADSVDCGPFVIEYSGIQYFTEKVWAGPDGEPALITLKFRFRETNVNSVSGKTLEMGGSVTETYDLADGTRTLTGAVFMGTEAGSGTFIHDSGRLIETIDTEELISVSGPHEGYFGSVDDLVCAALA